MNEKQNRTIENYHIIIYKKLYHQVVCIDSLSASDENVFKYSTLIPSIVLSTYRKFLLSFRHTKHIKKQHHRY